MINSSLDSDMAFCESDAQEGRAAYLIAFGDIRSGPDRAIAASEVFDRLWSAGTWYLRRENMKVRSGDYLLFYQNGLGLRGTATVQSNTAVAHGDDPLLRDFDRARFKRKLELSDRIISSPQSPWLRYRNALISSPISAIGGTQCVARLGRFLCRTWPQRLR